VEWREFITLVGRATGTQRREAIWDLQWKEALHKWKMNYRH